MRKRDLLGYGAATVADSGPYNFVIVYLILFLTTVVGMSPERAGTVLSAIVLIDGVTSVFIGYISDHTGSKHGRRRPYLLASVAPLVLGLALLFCKLPLEGTAQMAFYIIIGIIFWFGYGLYYTPYTALGAELTDDYNERSILRTYARFFGIAGNFIGVVLPLIGIRFLQDMGISEGGAWLMIALFVALASGIGILITWKSVGGKERPVEQIEERLSILKLVVEYVKIFRLKPFKHMMVVIAAFIIANTFYNSSMVFFARYNLGIGDEITSSIFLISIIANLVYTPVMGACSVRFGKKNVMAFSMLISGMGGMLLYVTGISSYLGMAVYACIFSVAYTCFWQLISAVMYDISEVAEYKFGKRLEGSISSVYGFVFTIFTSAAMQIFGWILKFGFVNGAFLLLPGIFLLIAAAAQFLYPINESSFEKLKEALEHKKRGEAFEISSLKRII